MSRGAALRRAEHQRYRFDSAAFNLRYLCNLRLKLLKNRGTNPTFASSSSMSRDNAIIMYVYSSSSVDDF